MSGAEGRSARPFEPAGVAMVVAALGGAARWWVRNGASALRWNDSADYLASAHSPWWSIERWLGPRPVLMPAALSTVGSRLQPFIDLQLVVASLTWALLALAVASGLPGGWRRWLAGLALLGLSVAGPLVMWDQQVLTESLAISALVLAAAAVTWAALGLNRRRAIALIAAVVVLLLARDSHVIPVVAAAIGLGTWAWWRRPARVRLALVTAGYLGALAFLAAGAATYGHREVQPLEHVYAVRVLPYPERIDWFAAHGMPDAERLRATPVAVDDVKAPYVPLAPGEWPRWRRWLEADGRATLARYAVAPLVPARRASKAPRTGLQQRRRHRHLPATRPPIDPSRHRRLLANGSDHLAHGCAGLGSRHLAGSGAVVAGDRRRRPGGDRRAARSWSGTATAWSRPATSSSPAPSSASARCSSSSVPWRAVGASHPPSVARERIFG